MKRKGVDRSGIMDSIRIRFLIFVCVWIGFCSTSRAFEAKEEGVDLYALSAVMIDAGTGRVLIGKEENVPRPMASTTKIMTCIVALESEKIDEVVTVSKRAQDQPKVHLGMTKGQRFRIEDLLYSLMLESHNDSAVAIAEGIAGSVEVFIRLMNEKAIEIGCQNTNFVTPNGLDGENEKGEHHTTAKDLALIMKYCIQDSEKSEEFWSITQTRTYRFNDQDQTRTYDCRNQNRLFDLVEGVISGKTGFTGKAGYCYVGAVEQKGTKWIVALLGCGWPNNKDYKWKDTKKLLEYGKKNYRKMRLREDAESLKLEIENGRSEKGLFDRVTLCGILEHADEGVLVHQKERIMQRILWDQKQAPIQKGERIGQVEYYIGDQLIRRQRILAKDTIKPKTLLWVFKQVLENYIGNNIKINQLNCLKLSL